MNNKLSVAIATYNEELNIVDCIESVKHIADEIVIVDGMSKDRTAAIAEKMGAKVFKEHNVPMFHINKNIAFKNCKNEWILYLDADERVTKELAAEISETIKSKPIANGFWINRRNWFLGGYLKKGGAYPDPVIRLFRKGKGFLPEKSVHEQVEIKGNIERLSSDLLHLADPSFERYLQRANRYTSLSASQFKKNAVKINTLSYFNYFFIKPFITFCKIYVRHKGYQDGFRGFVWALFSSSHYFYAFAKYSTNKKSS